MAATIKIKNSSTASAVPTSSDLVQGELAVNVTDKRIFTENASGTVVELGTNPSILTLPDGSASAPTLTNDGDTNTGIFFPAADTVGIATGGTERARVDSSGNLVLGATSGSALADRYIDINGTQAGLNFLISGTSQGYIYAGGSNEFRITATGSGGNSNFTSFYTGGSERMRLDTSGNLLVGTTSSAGQITALAPSGNNVAALRSAGAVSATRFIRFDVNTTTEVGSIQYNGTGTSYITTSDYRLKEDVQPMTGALAKVQSLKPCTYKWKNSGEQDEGFIAHELKEVCPRAVVGEKDAVNEDGSINPQGIDTSFLVATLTAAIQEQQAIIETLTARIEALEA
jgi:hypothetical protein